MKAPELNPDLKRKFESLAGAWWAAGAWLAGCTLVAVIGLWAF